MLIVKLILILLFAMIFFQDYKDRRVHWFLFPLVALCSGFLFYKSTLPELFLVSVALNTFFILFLLLVVTLYSKFVLKVNVTETFGLGDAFLFISLIFSFSTVSFLVVFVFALFFSLIIHLILKKYSRCKTVPLAGYLSLFFGFSYLAFWFGITNSLYAL
ncbi:general secretion pathway protein [uncultured Psychroserpens sp.]|uniref:general secretion pathway protein n=1 Tax=uncultured Psychroserpens sp. TaxID=255436 RepID=UPI002634E1D4|nr:general secretion pathway protein [uncultured Psychroserpens sp.]